MSPIRVGGHLISLKRCTAILFLFCFLAMLLLAIHSNFHHFNYKDASASQHDANKFTTTRILLPVGRQFGNTSVGQQFGNTSVGRQFGNTPVGRQFGNTPIGRQFGNVSGFLSYQDLNPNISQIVQNLYDDLCPNMSSLPPVDVIFDDILLVVTINYDNIYRSIPLVELLYRRHFPHILYCGPSPSAFKSIVQKQNCSLPWMHVERMKKGWYHYYECVHAAMEVSAGFSGYIQMGDDVLINLNQMKTLSRSKVWYGDSFLTRKERLKVTDNKSWWIWWETDMGQRSAFGVLTSLLFQAFHEHNQTAKNFLLNYEKHIDGENNVYFTFADFFYIPARLSSNFIHLASLFKRHKLIAELALPMYTSGLNWTNDVQFIGTADLWGYDRGQYIKFFADNITYLHPFKYGGDFKTKEGKNFICDTYIRNQNVRLK